jgi:hypothetical protein
MSLTRKEFLQLVGLTAATGAVTGAYGPEVRSGVTNSIKFIGRVVHEATEGFDQWKYGKTAVRIDELSMTREQLRADLNYGRVGFVAYENPTLQEVGISVFGGDDGSADVRMRLGEEEYYAVPTSGVYTDGYGKVHSYQTVHWMLRTSDGSDPEVFAADKLGSRFNEGLWVFAQGVAKLAGVNALTVYVGTGQTDDGRRYFATPLDSKENVSFFSIAIDTNGKERIFKASLTNTGPFGLNPGNVGAEVVEPLP